jgi:hypothetical protein
MKKLLRSQLIKTLLLSTLIFISLPLFSNAQGQRGKLTGIVKDEVTKEPLIGANVLILGTNIGAASDLDGRYVILNIPPGTYSVQVSSLGYTKVIAQEVEIIVDRTTTLNFTLKDASVQLEQVVVVAEKPKIIKDQTSSSSTLNESQLKAAPIEGLRGALDLAAGFQKSATGNYSVRGSGSYELNFQINGVEQTNSATSGPGTFGTEKANNSWKYDVNPLGVQQLQLITGGFSSEYGNAQAGVVKVILKDGSPKFSGEFRTEYRPAGQYHFGQYLYDKSNYEWQKWGNKEHWLNNRNSVINELNIPNRYKWLYDKFAANTATPEDSAYRSMIENREIDWAYDMWVKNHSPSDDNPLGVYDYRQYAYTRYMIGFGGPLGRDANLLKFYFSGEYKKNPTRLPTSEKNQIYQNYILNVTYQPITPLKIKTMLSYQDYKGGIWSGSEDIRWSGIAFSPPGLSSKYYVKIDPVRLERTVAQSLNMVYTISTNSFIEATVTHQQEKYELPYEYLPGYTQQRDVLDSLYDANGTVLRSGSWWESNQYFRPPDAVSTLYYQDTRTEHWSLSADYTNQIISTNLLKAGVRFYYWDMFNNGVNSSYQANSFLVRAGFAEYYRAYPYNVAVYVQDKMEYSGMIANIGLRAEAYNFQSNFPIDPYNIFYQGRSGPALGNPETVPSKTQFILLPRIGVSFPIGESTAFRIQYGHFASMPIFSHGLSKRTQSGWAGYGNPNLEPKKTIQYEFGLQQMVDEKHRLDVALYYNDRVTQIGLQRIASYTGTQSREPAGYTDDNEKLYTYTTFENNAFGATVGIDVTFEKIALENWTYRLSYSLSQTTEGNYGPQVLFPDNSRNYARRNYTGEFLSGNDRTHNFSGLLQYNIKNEEGLSILGFRPFENSTWSLTYKAMSGAPFTYVTSFDLKDAVNNRRYPLEQSFDFNFVKNIIFSGYRIIVGVRVMNLFDNKWLTPMPGSESSDDIIRWVEYGYTMEDPGNLRIPDDQLRKTYINAPFKAYRNIPRQIFFTLGFGF